MRRATAFFALLLLLLASTRASAQGSVSLEVDAGYDGYYSRSNGPTPVRIKVANASESFRARVELDSLLNDGKVVYYTELELPQNSEKLVTLYPAHSGLNVSTQVRVLNGRQVVAEATDKLASLDAGTRLYGVLAPNLGPYADLDEKGTQSPAAVARLALGALPDRADALSALQVIVVDGASTDALTAAQNTALRQWLQLGGTLVVAGGSNAAQNATGLADLLPVTLGSTRSAGDLSALAKLAGVAAPAGGGTINLARPAGNARIMAGSQQQPLVAARSQGQGRVVWLAWSPSAAPFSDWRGTPSLLRAVSGSATTPSVAQLIASNSWTLNRIVQNVAGARLPSTLIVAGFLLLYSIVLGPVVYLVLRRLDRRELAWLLVPAVTLVFTLLAYGANFLIRGTGTTLRALEVREAYSGSDVQAGKVYAALFSPSRRSYDISMPSTYTLTDTARDEAFAPPQNVNPGARPPSLYEVETGRDTVIRGMPADVYSFRSWSAETTLSGQQPALRAELQGNGSELSGRV
ncbi:MAG: hypothetical protein M3281_09810, partial [Chloroflexota bacterium]|nr:hypothetical protein [Chloroflexota bacterium]